MPKSMRYLNRLHQQRALVTLPADAPGSQVSGAIKSRTTNQIFQLGAKLYRIHEQGHGRLGDGGEVFGDVLFTGVEVVSTRGNMAKNSGFVQH
jgi:hypothetical protein